MKAGRRVRDFILGLDIFGHPIGVHYRGSDTYKTWLGALCTFAVYVLMLVNIIQLSGALADTSRLEEKFNQNKIDQFHEGAFNLAENNLDLAFFVFPKPPTDYGYIKVS